MDNFDSFHTALNENGILPKQLTQVVQNGHRLLAIEGKTICFHYVPRSIDEEEHFLNYEAGTNLMHVWEDVWLQKPEIVLSRLNATANLTVNRIHGRQTRVVRIAKGEAMQFLNQNHLQGAIPGKYRYGLFYKDQLVSVAVFSGGRKMKFDGNKRSFELLRFCHAVNTLVQGGLSKLLAAMQSDFKPDDIMTYIDKDWSEGEAFVKMGFKKINEKPPLEFWVSPEEMIRHYPKRLPENIGNTDELRTVGYFRIRNAGSIKLVKTYG